jgi:copper transport protein
VTFGKDAIVVLDAAGRKVPVQAANSQRDGKAVTTRPQCPIPPGIYTVRWRVTGSDGDEVEEEFRFAVGVALSAGTADGANPRPAWGTAALRWLLLAGLAVAIGALVAQHVTATARAEQPGLPVLRSWAARGVFVALAADVGLLIQGSLTMATSVQHGRAGPGLFCWYKALDFWRRPPQSDLVAGRCCRCWLSLPLKASVHTRA